MPSNYALARRFGLHEKSLTRWSTGANVPDDATAARLAELAGFDPDAIVAAMHAARARDEIERARWQRIAHRLSIAASVAGCAILAVWTTLVGVDGSALLALAPLTLVDSARDTLYIGAGCLLLAAAGARRRLA